MRKLVLSMSLMTAMFFVSCEQDSVNDEVYNDTSSYQSKSASATAVDCTPVSDSAVVTRTGPSTGNYCDWTPTPKTIGTVSVQWEGIYGSGFRPLTDDWYVGVVDPSYECGDSWNAIASAIEVKNVSTNVGSDPSCGTFIPQNVVGAIGTAYGSYFGTGYYEYDSTFHTITITKKVVIWKIEDENWPTENTDPNDADEAYLVEVTNIVPTHGASVYGTVSYTYTKVL